MLLGRTLPGIGFGYNAHGAYASVNHLHLQVFMRADAGYPIESMRWRHNGGSETYPRPCTDSMTDLSPGALRDLHVRDIAYNLVYRPGCLYLVKRRCRAAMCTAHGRPGSPGRNWQAPLRRFTLADFEGLTATRIEAELAGLVIRP